MRIVDLSMPISRHLTGIPEREEYEENPTRCVVLSTLSEAQIANLKDRNIEMVGNMEPGHHMMSRLEIMTHVGTHIDAPCHFLDATWSIDEVPLELTVKRGMVIPLTHKEPKSAVTAEDILATGIDFDDSVIPVLHTAWTDRAGGTTERFWNEMIYLDTSAAALMVERNVSAVAMDFFPEAPFWLGFKPDTPPAINHKTLLGNKTIIIQMLTNIGSIGSDNFMLVGVPLRLEGLDGSPARVFAMIE
ncbi:MAG: cyclase family protein [Gammaproteobacteria bacterium]